MALEPSRSRRVAMLAHTYYLRDPRVRREAEALAAADMEVHVICLREPRKAGAEREPRYAVINGVHIHRLPISQDRRRPGDALWRLNPAAAGASRCSPTRITCATLAFAGRRRRWRRRTWRFTSSVCASRARRAPSANRGMP